MLQTRIPQPIRAAEALNASLCVCFSNLRILPRPIKPATSSTTFIRHATHAAQGRANGPKDSAGRRLGLKKGSTELVIPGHIIFRQRGTKWHPGENVGMGRDHTIYATEKGYVRYYKDPERHPKRRYIGVALEKDGPHSILPTPRNAARRRRLNMFATSRSKEDDEYDLAFGSTPTDELMKASDQEAAKKSQSRRPQYMYREANWEIGRAAEKKGIEVREFNRKNRWLAWRKRAAKARRAAVLRAAKANRKGSAKRAKKAAN